VDLEEKLSYILQVFEKLDVTVRFEALGGQGGGVCRLKGKVQVFVDLNADPEVRYTTVLSGLAGVADVADMYILPEIRADLERVNCGKTR